MFHGEDLYMGLLLLRMRKNYKIQADARAVVRTFAPTTLGMLFRQRVTSWDLNSQRKFFSFLYELVVAWRGGWRELILKPYWAYEVLSTAVDWVRLALLVELIHYNVLALAFIFVFFFALMWLQLAIFAFVTLRHRPDLRPSIGTALVFPVYRSMLMLWRFCALLRNVVYYSSWTKRAVPISHRETRVADIPPLPYWTIQPDWNKVWTACGEERGHAGAYQQHYLLSTVVNRRVPGGVPALEAACAQLMADVMKLRPGSAGRVPRLKWVVRAYIMQFVALTSVRNIPVSEPPVPQWREQLAQLFMHTDQLLQAELGATLWARFLDRVSARTSVESLQQGDVPSEQKVEDGGVDALSQHEAWVELAREVVVLLSAVSFPASHDAMAELHREARSLWTAAQANQSQSTTVE